MPLDHVPNEMPCPNCEAMVPRDSAHFLQYGRCVECNCPIKSVVPFFGPGYGGVSWHWEVREDPTPAQVADAARREYYREEGEGL